MDKLFEGIQSSNIVSPIIHLSILKATHIPNRIQWWNIQPLVIAPLILNAPSNKSHGEWSAISAYKDAVAVGKWLFDIYRGMVTQQVSWIHDLC